jgi:S-adenosylmethionine:tRNA ribosyltransferase-isomerase
VAVDRITDHVMHAERYAVTGDAAARINAAARVIAVGTTVTRVLESLRACAPGTRMQPGGHRGATDIFLHPPYQFGVVGGLLTNFHLPQSTLLMLVCAFAGRELALEAYRRAVAERYRFYSYGDCMLLL